MKYQSLRSAGLLALAIAGLALASTAQAAESAGNVILAVGTVTGQTADGSRHTLRSGDEVYAGESLNTGGDSYLDLVFADGGRILLRPDTGFQIERFHYAPPPPADAPPTPAVEHESAFFRLLKGGLSAISGLIGHVTRANYRMDTPVATIGIRGTEYEVRYCANDCRDAADKSAAPENGLYTAVDKDAIALSNQTHEVITTAPASSCMCEMRTHPSRCSSVGRRPCITCSCRSVTGVWKRKCSNAIIISTRSNAVVCGKNCVTGCAARAVAETSDVYKRRAADQRSAASTSARNCWSSGTVFGE